MGVRNIKILNWEKCNVYQSIQFDYSLNSETFKQERTYVTDTLYEMLTMYQNFGKFEISEN